VSPSLRRWFVRGSAIVVAAAGFEVLAPGCSLGEGTGYVKGTLNVPLCWSGSFNLNPTFFAAVPYNSGSIDSGSPDGATTTGDEVSSLEIRIQNGGDYETFSDGVLILVDNVHAVRGDPPYPSDLGKKLELSLPPAVVAPGVPIPPVSNPATVSLSLYLEKSCQTEQIALYALEKVTLNADGSCNPTEAGPLTLDCGVDNGLVDAGLPDGGRADAAGAALPTASSWIDFTSLFDGNPYETDAAKRLSVATFDAYLGDPRDGCPGGLGPPPPCRGHITGQFSFYFERGQPAQPFQ
jgi:hypothetical protein